MDSNQPAKKEEKLIECYVVRIYRRDKGKIVGMVEDVDKKDQTAFACIEDLWKILSPGATKTV